MRRVAWSAVAVLAVSLLVVHRANASDGGLNCDDVSTPAGVESCFEACNNCFGSKVVSDKEEVAFCPSIKGSKACAKHKSNKGLGKCPIMDNQRSIPWNPPQLQSQGWIPNSAMCASWYSHFYEINIEEMLKDMESGAVESESSSGVGALIGDEEVDRLAERFTCDMYPLALANAITAEKQKAVLDSAVAARQSLLDHLCSEFGRVSGEASTVTCTPAVALSIPRGCPGANPQEAGGGDREEEEEAAVSEDDMPVAPMPEKEKAPAQARPGLRAVDGPKGLRPAPLRIGENSGAPGRDAAPAAVVISGHDEEEEDAAIAPAEPVMAPAEPVVAPRKQVGRANRVVEEIDLNKGLPADVDPEEATGPAVAARRDDGLRRVDSPAAKARVDSPAAKAQVGSPAAKRRVVHDIQLPKARVANEIELPATVTVADTDLDLLQLSELAGSAASPLRDNAEKCGALDGEAQLYRALIEKIADRTAEQAAGLTEVERILGNHLGSRASMQKEIYGLSTAMAGSAYPDFARKGAGNLCHKE